MSDIDKRDEMVKETEQKPATKRRTRKVNDKEVVNVNEPKKRTRTKQTEVSTNELKSEDVSQANVDSDIKYVEDIESDVVESVSVVENDSVAEIEREKTPEEIGPVLDFPTNREEKQDADNIEETKSEFDSLDDIDAEDLRMETSTIDDFDENNEALFFEDDEDTIDPRKCRSCSDMSLESLCKIAIGIAIVCTVISLITVLICATRRQPQEYKVVLNLDTNQLAEVLEKVATVNTERIYYISSENEDMGVSVAQTTDAENDEKSETIINLIEEDEQAQTQSENQKPVTVYYTAPEEKQESSGDVIYNVPDSQETEQEPVYMNDKKPYLGVECVTVADEFVRCGFPSGVYITAVQEGQAAKIAGLEPEDIITAINGTPIVNTMEFTSLISGTKPGDVITLSVSHLQDNRFCDRDVQVIVGAK